MSAFAWFLLILLASRVLLIARDEPLTNRQAFGLGLAQSVALLTAAPDLSLLPLLVLTLTASPFGAWLERRDPLGSNAYRLIVLMILLLAAGLSFAPAQGIVPNPMLAMAGDWLSRHLLYAAWMQGTSSLLVTLVLIGSLLVINEANLLIRLILQSIRGLSRILWEYVFFFQTIT